MGQPNGDLTDVDYLWLMTIYEMLELVITHCEQAENAQSEWTLEANLKMASRAMRSALEIYGGHINEELKK